jgi:tryptophanyl-tRNA synthetase
VAALSAGSARRSVSCQDRWPVPGYQAVPPSVRRITDEIRRLVARIVTDSRSPSEPKDPDTVLALHRQLADAGDADDLSRRYRQGTVGYPEANALLAGVIQQLAAPGSARHAELMSELMSDPARLKETLARGAVLARKAAAATLDAVRAPIGLGWG